MSYLYSHKDLPSLIEKKIFFDTNILIYIFWPVGSRKQLVNRYSTMFSQLLKSNNEMIIDQTIISELVNTALRLEYNKYLNKKKLNRNTYTFKKYRNSAAGNLTQATVYNVVKKLLKHFSVNGKIFTDSEINKLLTVDSLDFSDKLILSICKENNYILLSNDNDFKNHGIDLLNY